MRAPACGFASLLRPLVGDVDVDIYRNFPDELLAGRHIEKPADAISAFGRFGKIKIQYPVIAYRFNNFAYASDLNFISDKTIAGLQGLDVLVLDCVRIKPHSTHLGLNEALEYIEKIKPQRAFLTHLNHDVMYSRDSELLPPNVEFAYDGLVVE